MTINDLKNRERWTTLDDSFDETVDSVDGMYTMLEYNDNKHIKALITYRDCYIQEYSKWATIYFYNDDGKCYNKIEGHLGFGNR
jgi:hypothetical protein